MTEADLRKKSALGLLDIQKEHMIGGALKKADVKSEKYTESDAALLKRVLARELGETQNILVINDEAHHAYRLHDNDEAEESSDVFGEEAAGERYYKEATVWVDGLDKVHKYRGINMCVDFSATPYFIGRAGEQTNRIFPWTVSNFGLQDAIESGLVKIPQLAARDTSAVLCPVISTSGNGYCHSCRPLSVAVKKATQAGGGFEIRAYAACHVRRHVGSVAKRLGKSR